MARWPWEKRVVEICFPTIKTTTGLRRCERWASKEKVEPSTGKTNSVTTFWLQATINHLDERRWTRHDFPGWAQGTPLKHFRCPRKAVGWDTLVFGEGRTLHQTENDRQLKRCREGDPAPKRRYQTLSIESSPTLRLINDFFWKVLPGFLLWIYTHTSWLSFFFLIKS